MRTSIVNRNTTDYSFNFGLSPTLHLGTNVLTFSTGIQETIRRDSLSPVQMNQNLFRQFIYMSTSSFFNMVSVSGFAIREAGPFTESTQHSRELAGALNFRVGRPWGKTALVTGWGASDQQFSPVISENYYTSAYLGVQHQISQSAQLHRCRRAPAGMAYLGIQLRDCAGTAPGWKRSVCPNAQLERAGVSRLFPEYGCARLRRGPERLRHLLCNASPPRV